MRRPRYEQAESAVLAALGSFRRLPAEAWQIRASVQRSGGISYDRAQAALQRLVSDGRVLKARRGWYDLPPGSPYAKGDDQEAVAR